MIFFLLIMLGVIAGIMAGFFGVGGGILFTPILFFLFNAAGISDPVSWTIGTSLFCTFTAAAGSSVQQNNHRNIFWKEGVLVGLFGTAGIYFGKEIATSAYYTQDVFVSFFAMLLVFVSVLFYRRSRSDVTLQVAARKMGIAKSAGAGVAGGFVAALAGVGGGVVLVPLMNLGFRLSISKAVSISSLAIVLISLSGWLQYAFFAGELSGFTDYTIGYVDFGTGLPLIIGAFFGGLVGVKATRKVSGKTVQVGFSILILVIAFVMIWNLF